jgi:hypothetical protein
MGARPQIVETGNFIMPPNVHAFSHPWTRRLGVKRVLWRNVNALRIPGIIVSQAKRFEDRNVTNSDQ